MRRRTFLGKGNRPISKANGNHVRHKAASEPKPISMEMGAYRRKNHEDMVAGLLLAFAEAPRLVFGMEWLFLALDIV